MTDYRKDAKLGELIFAVMNGQANDQQQMQLGEILCNDASAMKYYMEFMVLYSGLSHHLGGEIPAISEIVDYDLSLERILQIAAGQSDAASEIIDVELSDDNLAIRVEQDIRERERIERIERRDCEKIMQNQTAVKHPRIRPTRKLIMRWATGAAAALIFSLCVILLDRYLMQQTQLSQSVSVFPTVATLVDYFDTEWDDSAIVNAEGTLLDTRPKRLLRGYAQIRMNSGVEIVINAPCEFELEGENQIFLTSGKIVADVPPDAIGFLVRSQKGTIVDYGTEFGVIAQKDGYLETHVFKGQVIMRLGANVNYSKHSQRLTAGKVGVIKMDGGLSLSDEIADESQFVRSFKGFWTSGNQNESYWSSANNWRNNKIPSRRDPAIFINMKAPCIVNSYVECNRLVIGENGTVSGEGVLDSAHLKILDNGNVNIFGWASPGYGNPGILEIFAGGVLNCRTHLIIGNLPGSQSSQFIMHGGSANIAQALLIGYRGGDGGAHIHGGVLDINYMVIKNGFMDITNGFVVINGNRLEQIKKYEAVGKIKAFGGKGKLIYDYNETHPGKTTISALQ